jgi:hypothetical protein
MLITEHIATMFEVKVWMKILLSASHPKSSTVVVDNRARGFHRPTHQLEYLQLVVVRVSQLKSVVASTRWLFLVVPDSGVNGVTLKVERS